MAQYKVYGDSRSGNCYKVQLTAAQVGVSLDWEEVDVLSGRTRSSEFLARNPNGKIPLLELDDGRYLSESNAIISYLAHATELLPSEPWALAQVNQWLFWEQYSHEPNIATLRFWMSISPTPEAHYEQVVLRRPDGERALNVMEQHLQNNDWFAADRYTIADIGLFAYTHVAADGGFNLYRWPRIQAWLARVTRQPGFAAMNTDAYNAEPLREFKGVRQVRGESPRRWWHCADMDLIVWFASGARQLPTGFQLTSGLPHKQRSLIWKSEQALIKERIDSGEESGMGRKQTPISVNDGDTDPAIMLRDFENRASAVDADIQSLVRSRLSGAQ